MQVNRSTATYPRPSELRSLRASNLLGLLVVGAASLLTAVSILLSNALSPLSWLTGQLLLSLALMHGL